VNSSLTTKVVTGRAGHPRRTQLVTGVFTILVLAVLVAVVFQGVRKVFPADDYSRDSPGSSQPHGADK